MDPKCSFCGKLKAEVKHLMASNDDRFFICDRCAIACKKLLLEDEARRDDDPPPLTIV